MAQPRDPELEAHAKNCLTHLQHEGPKSFQDLVDLGILPSREVAVSVRGYLLQDGAIQRSGERNDGGPGRPRVLYRAVEP